MKKTQLIELLNIIKSSKVSFIAIFMFISLGIAIFSGIGWSGQAFEDSLDAEFLKQGLKDIEVVFPYGFEKSDIKRLRSLENVDDAEGTYSTCQFFDYKGEKYQAKIQMISKKNG